MSSDRDIHQNGYSYGAPSYQQQHQPQIVTPTQSPNASASAQFPDQTVPQQYSQVPMKMTMNNSPVFSQYASTQPQAFIQPSYPQPTASSGHLDQNVNHNFQPYKRDSEYVHTPTPPQSQESHYQQQMVSPDEQRYQNERLILNRANSAPVFMQNMVHNSNNGIIYQSPTESTHRSPMPHQQSDRKDIPHEHYNQKSYTPQPYEAPQYGRSSWTQPPLNTVPYEYLRDPRFLQPVPSPEYYQQFPTQQYAYPPVMGFHPMDMRFQSTGYPVYGSNNVPYFSMGAQSGPIPASKPKLSVDEKTGEELITFSYSKQKVIREFTVRVPAEGKFDTSFLTEDFKKNNCVYPKAVVPADQYKGNRYKYETECNEMGWTLSWFNEEIRDHRGLIQRAVDSWRNTRPDKSIRSRRARRDI